MSVCLLRVQLNEAQDEIMKKKELLEDLQPDNTQTCKSLCPLCPHLNSTDCSLSPSAEAG